LKSTYRTAIATTVLVILGALTWQQSGMYRGPETLYRETLVRNPGSDMAHQNLGNLLLDTPGKLNDAIAEFEEALRIEPNIPEVHNSLGGAFMRVGRLPEATAEFETAVRLKPDYPDGHNSLGSALAQTPGRTADGIAEFQTALRLRPDFATAHYNLGSALLDVPGRRQDAIAEFEKALQIQPDFQQARQMLQRLESGR
jgi:tetratricopeptide (TPR) repeat protein